MSFSWHASIRPSAPPQLLSVHPWGQHRSISANWLPSIFHLFISLFIYLFYFSWEHVPAGSTALQRGSQGFNKDIRAGGRRIWLITLRVSFYKIYYIYIYLYFCDTACNILPEMINLIHCFPGWFAFRQAVCGCRAALGSQWRSQVSKQMNFHPLKWKQHKKDSGDNSQPACPGDFHPLPRRSTPSSAFHSFHTVGCIVFIQIGGKQNRQWLVGSSGGPAVPQSPGNCSETWTWL